MSLLKLHSCLLVVFIALIAIDVSADEVIIDGNAKSKVSVGDFDCSKCPTPSDNVINLLDGDSGITAGELWQFFDSQGVESVNRLTLCVDLQPESSASRVGLNSMELRIEDPSKLGSLLTNVSLGGNSLVFPNYDISSYKPEANLEINLGYDFMERFSANSKEKILLDVDYDGSIDSQPVVSVEGENGLLSKKFNLFAIIGFAFFWAMVFMMLNRFTKPQVATPEVAPRPVPKRQALSA